MVDETYRNNQIQIAHTLGHRIVGTAGNPANPTLGTLAAWQGYAQQANTVGAALRAAGLKYFFHPEQDWFRFFDDPAHPELARVHRIDWFTDNTDPRYVFFEPDTMHTLAGRARFVDPVDGSLFDVNAWYGRLAARRRRRRLRRRGLDRQGLPLRHRPGGARLRALVHALPADRPGLVRRRERHQPGQPDRRPRS